MTGLSPEFRKEGPLESAAMFRAEAAGLAALTTTGTVRVPTVLDVGADNTHSWIVLERFELLPVSITASERLGRELAALHRRFSDRFGWDDDNFIGPTPQPNAWHDDWPEFFATQRLGYQVDLAEENGFAGPVTRGVRRLIERLPELLAHRPRPSLLHGDLWSGNHGMLPDGTPVVFDPAVHYGDRECDLAMAALFGGFDNAFFDAYIEAWPMAAGWQQRWKVYQLYHVLNHVNLFGAGYLGQAEALVRGVGT
ncbi:MAG: fructosamine kinase family protein [Xanthomonadaceae bacterium]|nr:fructosamine kinase family protein [Xanthomonadaceae bacterium]